MKVGIVGGSIAGCTAGIELLRAGHRVSILERSRGGLTGRGAGIGTPMETIETLVSRDLIDADMPRIVVSEHAFASRKDANDRYGHRALTLPLNMALLNWGDLWWQLRSRIPDSAYGEGTEVMSSRLEGDEVVLTATDGWCETYDLVLFADGYQSIGRRALFPDLRPSYRGYVLWRGVLVESQLSETTPLEAALYRLHYNGLPGNGVFYLVPGKDGSTSVGRRWVNWACYIPVEAEALGEFLVDRHGRRHEHSLPPGSMRPREESRLKKMMTDHLPTYFAEIVSRSADTFAQPIFAVAVPANAVGRRALLGDAGAVAPPFTGSGVFKAMMNAVELAAALRQPGSTLDVLGRWSGEQAGRGRRLAALGEQMERAFVWDAPDFSTMAESTARAWWTKAITFPDDFSYISSKSVAIVLSVALSCVGASCAPDRAAQGQASDTSYSFARMADGKQWMTENLRLSTPGSYCYEDLESNCRRYGRLYAWEAAQLGCQSLGDGWRLPTDEDWRQMAKGYGGIFDDSADRGRVAYESLSIGGSSGFDALLGGARGPDDGRYDDLEAHGFYWTASESGSAGAWYYNFGRGSLALYRQGEGEQQMALAVRCVRE